MFNMYREVEKPPKPTLKQRIENFKEGIVLSLTTSVYNRLKQIKRLTEQIPEADIYDTEKLNEMHDTVVKLDLDDPRRGKVLPKELLDMLNEKLDENQKWLEDQENAIE